jgi:hypothetical protein
MEEVMSEDEDVPNPRDQLVSQIAEGDTATLVALTATLLAKEVLPALDELNAKVERLHSMVHWKLDEAGLALDMAITVYERLRELGMLSQPFVDRWRSLQQRREKLLEREWSNESE